LTLYIILAILIFALLIFVHELGHFLSAKLFGVRVNEFSLCMGPAIWQKTVGETTYSIRAIPIGGFCAMEGEDEDTDDPRSFQKAKPWKRIIILAAGSLMNFLVGVLLLLALYAPIQSVITPTIIDFQEGCLLEGDDALQVGDTFYRIDGERVYQYSNLDLLLGRNTSGVFDLEVIRDGQKVKLHDFVMEKQAFELDGETRLLYGFLFGYEEMTFSRYLRHAWYNAVDFVRMVRLSLQDLVSGLVKPDDISGPVGIVSIIADTGKSAETTAQAALNISYLAAFLAVNLAVMNLLPIPALDGGRIVFLVITAILEKLLKRKINPKYEGYIHAATMILLFGFIAFITLHDIGNLIGR